MPVESTKARAALAGLMILAVIALVAASVAEELRNAGRMIGVGMQETDAGIEITRVGEGSAAQRGGVRAGDVLVAVNGFETRQIPSYDEQARSFSPAHPAVFSVLREGRRLELKIVPGAPVQWARLLISKLAALGYLLVALIAWWQRSDDLRARLLFFFSLAVAVELAMPLGLFGPALLAASAHALFLALSGLEMGVELHLASVIPRRQNWLRRAPWVVFVYYAGGIGFAAASGVVVFTEIFGYQIVPVTTSDLTVVLNRVILPVWCLAVPILLGIQAFRYPEPRGRHQAGLVLVGVLPWTLFTLVNTLLPGQIQEWFGWFASPLESLGLLCYPIAVFLAMFRYQLFDIELVVRRGMVYTVLAAILVALFYVFVGAGGTLLSTVASETSSVWVVSGATLLLGLLFSPLRSFVQEQVDRRVFPERYALRQRLIEVAEELPELAKLPRMGDFLVRELRDIFAVQTVRLLLSAPDSELFTVLATSEANDDTGSQAPFLIPVDASTAAVVSPPWRAMEVKATPLRGSELGRRLEDRGVTLVVPVATRRRLIGLLMLGARHEGGAFPAEEMELLSLVSHLVASTFENARLFESATIEGLTGLLRRESIIERLQEEMNRARRYNRPLTVGMGDLDHFKEVNDHHGHLSGDAVLRQVASTIAASLRASDSVGRYGGEEFLFVLPETTLHDGVVVAEKIRSAVAGLEARTDDGNSVQVTISVGLAELSELPSSGGTSSPAELIAVADNALYAAKREGRNRVNPEPDA